MKSSRFLTLAAVGFGALLGYTVATGKFGLLPRAEAAPQPALLNVALEDEGQKEIIAFEVRLPADAVLMIDDYKTTSTGERRTFETPPLAKGGHYAYTLKATSGGKEATRKIQLAHG